MATWSKVKVKGLDLGQYGDSLQRTVQLHARSSQEPHHASVSQNDLEKILMLQKIASHI